MCDSFLSKRPVSFLIPSFGVGCIDHSGVILCPSEIRRGEKFPLLCFHSVPPCEHKAHGWGVLQSHADQTDLTSHSRCFILLEQCSGSLGSTASTCSYQHTPKLYPSSLFRQISHFQTVTQHNDQIKVTRQAARTTLVICIKTLDALLQSMSQRQVSHSCSTLSPLSH